MQWKLCSKMAVVFSVLTVALVLTPGAWAAPKYSVLYSFKGGRDGLWPFGSLVADAAGNLYGVTAAGGLPGGEGGGCGTVFELKREKAGWAHVVLFRFPANANDGCRPLANLAFDGAGNLYGTTDWGGQGDCGGMKCGTVFELAPGSKGEWKETVLHRFAGGRDGRAPDSGLLFDAAGNLYGTTAGGGSNSDCPSGCGTVYELTPAAGGGWNEEILHSFTGTDGDGPEGLVFDNEGNLYGTTGNSGLYEEGAAFELSPGSGGGWNESTIYSFEGFQDGAGPGPMTFQQAHLFGATDIGGSGDHGTIFELEPGSNGWTHTVLYSFTGRKDGRGPESPFVFDKSGNLYGVTGGDEGCVHGYHMRCGNVFEMKKLAGEQWKLQILHTFTGPKSGWLVSPPIFDGDGNLFGVTFTGGNCTKGYGERCGVAFEVVP